MTAMARIRAGKNKAAWPLLWLNRVPALRAEGAKSYLHSVRDWNVLAYEKASSADRLFSGDHDCAASPNIPSAPLRCACSNPYALDEYRVPTDCNRRFLESGNPSSPREKLSPLRAKVERSA